jgi:hypothetical protein
MEDKNMNLFNLFRVATEPNDYETEIEDQVWIRNDKGQLILMEVKDDDDN